MDYDLRSQRYIDQEFCIARSCNGGTWCGKALAVMHKRYFPSVEAASGMPGNVCRDCWRHVHDSFVYRNNEPLGPYSLDGALKRMHEAEAMSARAAKALEAARALVADDAVVAEIDAVLHHNKHDWLWQQMGEPIGECSVLFALPLVEGKARVPRGWSTSTPLALRATPGALQFDIGLSEREGQAQGKFPNICRIDIPIHKAEIVRDFINKMLDPETIIPALLRCPKDGCRKIHVDRGEWTTRKHRTHLCEYCGTEWRPSERYTVGVEEAP